MYCTCCGKKIMDGCNFCPECGAQINMNAKRGEDVKENFILGEPRNVLLLTGEVRELYLYNGLYYYDKFCTRLFPIGMISMQYRNPGITMTGIYGFGMLHIAALGALANKIKK